MKFMAVDTHLIRSDRPNHEGYIKTVSAIISLQTGFSEELFDDWYENYKDFDRIAQAVPRHTWYEIPCSNFFPPSEAQVKRFLSIVDHERSKQKTVLFHCFSGVDRTGFMAAVWRMQRQGYSFERAYSEWVAAGRHWWFFWWKPFLKKWATHG